MIIFLFLTDSTVYRQCNRQDTCTINEVYILYVRNNAVVYYPLWRPDNQITMVFLILTFYLRLFAGFADIVDYLRYDIGKAEGLSGIVTVKIYVADIVSSPIS